jgi:hypothetical protein
LRVFSGGDNGSAAAAGFRAAAGFCGGGNGSAVATVLRRLWILSAAAEDHVDVDLSDDLC